MYFILHVVTTLTLQVQREPEQEKTGVCKAVFKIVKKRQWEGCIDQYIIPPVKRGQVQLQADQFTLSTCYGTEI